MRAGGFVRKTLLKAAISLGVIVLYGACTSAFADTITFNFNTLSSSATNSGVQTYMNGLLSAGQHVTVTGSKAGGSYTGDGHVVGPCDSSGLHTCHPVTLDSAGGNFIINSSSTSPIVMTFTGVSFTTVSFDLEIFPDGTCANGSSGICGTNNSNWPDFEFYVNGTLVNTWLAKMPGDTTHGGSAYTHSPASHYYGTERAPQLLYYGYSYTSAVPITSLTFKDWPATIGVDNLQLSTPPKVPEPSSLALLGTGVIAIARVIRRKISG